MTPEVFFDCPKCAHALKVSRELVGREVDCPKCSSRVVVPDIRDGLRPRLRSMENKVQQALNTSSSASRLEQRKSAALLDELDSLSRRMTEQGRQLDYLQHNVSICVKQLNLVRDKSTSTIRTSMRKRTPVQKGPPSGLLLKWSLTCSLWVIAAGMVMMLYLFAR